MYLRCLECCECHVNVHRFDAFGVKGEGYHLCNQWAESGQAGLMLCMRSGHRLQLNQGVFPCGSHNLKVYSHVGHMT